MREVVLSDDKERTASFECLKYEEKCKRKIASTFSKSSNVR